MTTETDKKSFQDDVATARHNLRESLVYLPAWDADRAQDRIMELEDAVRRQAIGAVRAPASGAFTWSDLVNLVDRERHSLEGSAPVMFVHDEEGHYPTLYTTKRAKVQPQSDDGEGNVTSAGGTAFLYGTEY